MSDQPVFKEFIRRVRNGDPGAVEDLVRQYEPLVRRELRIKMTDRRLSKLFDSVDVCQSIWSSFFARVTAGQYDLDSPQHLATLLATMAKNKLASQARKQHAQKRAVGRIDENQSDLSMLPDDDETPSVCLMVEELQTRIQACLTDEERSVSELRRGGMTWEAVAQALGGTAQARRMQLDRAAQRVIDELGLSE